MTLDEAISKAKADGDVQLAEWLRQARGADAAGRWYTETLDNANRTIRKLKTENAELRELCESLFRLANNECLGGTRDCDDCPMNRSEPPCSLALDFIAMRRLGIDVTPWVVKRVEVNE